MKNKKKAIITLMIIAIAIIVAVGISKIGIKNDDEKMQNEKTQQTLDGHINDLNNDEIKENNKEDKETKIEDKEENKRPLSLESVQLLHADDDYSFIVSEDLYEHMDKMLGRNFLTIATIDKITDKEVTLVLKEGTSSIVFNTAEDYTKLVKSGKEVAVLGTIYEYNEVDGKKIITAWVSFLASGKDVEQFAEKVTNPCFSDIFD